MPLESRRSDTLRDSTAALLQAGEQSHIEFKSTVVIGAVPKQVAAGANFVAFQPAVEVHTILYGVAEDDSQGTGATTGVVVGLFEEDGSPADLDALQLQIEQRVHGTVRPQPEITIYQENVATRAILVVEVRPTSAPHVIDDRWNIRGVGGIRALTQGEALQIFKNQRLAAWIDEFEGSDPLKQALAVIRDSIDDLRLQGFAEEFEPDAHGSVDGSQASALRGVEESLGAVEAKVDQALAAIEEATEQARYAADNTSTESAESVWLSTLRTRMMRLHTAHSFASRIGTARIELVDDLVRDQLGETASITAYPQNLSELAGYHALRRAGGDRAIENDAVADLVKAVLWRRNGLPPMFGIDWFTSVTTMPELSQDLLDRDSVSGVELEVGLLHLPGISTDRVIDALGGTLSVNQHVVSVGTPVGVYRLAVPESGEVWAILFVPRTEVDTDATGDIHQTKAALSALITESGGASWCVEGPGVAIPTS